MHKAGLEEIVKDKVKEHIKDAIRINGYTDWIFDHVTLMKDHTHEDVETET